MELWGLSGWYVVSWVLCMLMNWCGECVGLRVQCECMSLVLSVLTVFGCGFRLPM